MKKKGIIFLVLGVFLLFLSGCGAEMLLPNILTAGSAALTAVDVKGAMKSVYYRWTSENPNYCCGYHVSYYQYWD